MDETAARSACDQALRSYEQDFGTFFLARLLDLQISYTDKSSLIRFPVRDFLFNPQGTLAGGIIAMVADIAMGHLLKHAVGVGGATLEIKVQYLSPLRDGEARCEARFLRQGRRINFLEARMFDHEGTLAAVATSTMHVGQPVVKPAESG